MKQLDMDERPRLTRTSKPKVKTGCVTCKLRRVKCDEAKPTCERCRLAGRQCHGYALRPVTVKQSSNNAAMDLLLCRTPSVYSGNDSEVRALEFFYRKTAPHLSSYFDADFWTRLIYQMSHAEESIRHAMIALGSLAKHHIEDTERVPFINSVAVKEVFDTPDPNRMNLPLIQTYKESEERFALTHYNRAIVELASRLSSDIPVEVVLLACILFVSLEFLRGNLQSALKHFRSGMNVALASPFYKSSVGPQELQRIEQNIIPFFSRLEFLSTLLGNDVDWDYAVELEDTVPSTFTNMRQARDSLVHIMNIGVRFIRSNKFRRYQNVDLSAEVLRQKAIRRQLDRWQQSFDSLILSGSVTALDLEIAKVLRLHQMIAISWTVIALTSDDMSTDEWIPLFEQATSLGEAIVGLGDAHGGSSSPSFLFDMEVVSPLWFVIIKCRHPLIRRRATQVLSRASRRQGLWDSQLAVVMAERLMAIEERNMKVLDGSELPPASDRVHVSHITTIPTASLETQRHVFTHYFRPRCFSEPWRTLHEEILLARSEKVF